MNATVITPAPVQRGMSAYTRGLTSVASPFSVSAQAGGGERVEPVDSGVVAGILNQVEYAANDSRTMIKMWGIDSTFRSSGTNGASTIRSVVRGSVCYAFHELLFGAL